MLEHLIKKYKENDVDQVVYRLSYAGKFIIIKGKTLCGSLIIISNTFPYYKKGDKKYRLHLYRHLYNHYISHPGYRFRVKKLAQVGPKTTQYDLLKKEQMELDKHRYNKMCLNNAVRAYLPLYNESTESFGWIEKTAVMSFKKWLRSKHRRAYVKRYRQK